MDDLKEPSPSLPEGEQEMDDPSFTDDPRLMETIIKRLRARLADLERREAEQRAREARLLWLSSVVEQTDELVLITDRAGTIVYVNPAFVQRTGYTQKEAIGKNPRIVRSGEQGKAFYEELWSTISEGKIFRGVLVNRTKSGERYYEEKTITPLKDAAGTITHYVSTGKDITSRIAADEERKRLVAILEATTDFVAIATVEGEIVYLNRAARRCLGRSETEKLSHLMLSEIYPEWARALVAGEGIPTAVRNGVWHGETAVLNRSGDEIPISQLFLAHRTPAGEVEFLSTIARDISDRKAQTAGLEYRATHDPLTTLPNRALFFDRLRYTLLAAQREKSSFALFIVDLDRFKEINDTHGHYVGDLVLKEVALRLQEALRESDTVARIGGDEFAVILPGADLGGGRRAAEKILIALARPIDAGKISLSARASIGMTLFPDHGGDLDDLIRRADEIMYAVKRSGGGYEVYASKNETSG